MARKPLVRCKFCGTVGRSKILWRGSKFLERFLWVTLLLPGPLYTYWRWRGRTEVCAHCESENIEMLPDAEPPSIEDGGAGYGRTGHNHDSDLNIW